MQNRRAMKQAVGLNGWKSHYGALSAPENSADRSEVSRGTLILGMAFLGFFSTPWLTVH
jgi:hypothetical protein